MKAKLEQELRELQLAFETGNSGISTNEYCSMYYQLSQRIKVAVN